MKQSRVRFPFKRMSSYKKKKKEHSSSSSSSSSLGAAANVVVEPELPRRNACKIKDTLLIMGQAMEHALVGDEAEHKKKQQHKAKDKTAKDKTTKDKTAKDKTTKEKRKGDEMEKDMDLSELQQPVVNQLDFLQRRKLAAAQMRIWRELEMEKEDHSMRHHLLNLHYLPPVLQDATTLNLTRFQTAQAWAKAQERVSEMKLNRFRGKKKDSLISNTKDLIKKTWKYLDKSTDHFMVLF